jgi:Fe-S-cluster containining protein
MQDKDAKRLGHRMLKMYEDQEPAIQKLAAENGATCRKGCSHCCNLMIYISLPEAIAIAETLLQLPPQALGAISRNLFNATQKLQYDRTAHFNTNTPCVFLDAQRSCSIYTVRPTPCRTYFVVSQPSNCSSEGGEKTVTRINTQAFDLEAIEEALRLSKQRGYPPLIAPIPVAVLWAIRLVTEGEAGFIKTLAEAPPQGMADIRSWTMHIMDSLGEEEMPPSEVPAGLVTIDVPQT